MGVRLSPNIAPVMTYCGPSSRTHDGFRPRSLGRRINDTSRSVAPGELALCLGCFDLVTVNWRNIRVSLLLLPVLLSLSSCLGLFPSKTTRETGPPPEVQEQLPTVLFAVLPMIEGLNGQALERSVLVPLACYGRGTLEGGQRCLSFMGQGGMPALEGGETVASENRARPFCPGAYHHVSGLGMPGQVTAGFGIWPAKKLSQVKVPAKGMPWKPSACKGWCAFGRTGHPRVRVEPEQMARLSAAARAAGMPPEAGDLEVLQEYALDMDGDGRLERFYSLAAQARDPDEYAFLFSALVMQAGKGRPMLVRRQDSAAVVLRGAVDLDGDGRRELWLLLTPTSGGGIAHEVIQIGQGTAVQIGNYTCQPRD